MKIQKAIKETIEQRDLAQQDAYEVAIEIMSGDTTDAQIAALLTALRMKGETADEITGFVQAMREKVTPVRCSSESIVDTCGTGGDGTGTFNISTISAFVAAGAGCKIAKHGNRSVSSKCGSADLLKALDINIEISPEQIAKCIDQIGFGFLFAPILHKAMKHAIGPRREMGVRTIFNILGPLTNPAGAKRQLLGVFNKELITPLTKVLQNLGSEHCMIVHSEDGLDEITTTGKTFVSELCNGSIKEYVIEPNEFNIQTTKIDDIKGGSIEDNVRIAIDVLNGEKGPKRDVVILNAGAAIYVGKRAKSLADGIECAKDSIDSGKALEKLNLLQEMTG